MLRMFGLSEGPPAEIGWGTLDDSGTGGQDVSMFSPFMVPFTHGSDS